MATVNTDVVDVVCFGIATAATKLLCLFDDDDDEEDVVGGPRGWTPAKFIGFVDHVIPLYTNKEFKEHFRLERDTFEVVLSYVGDLQWIRYEARSTYGDGWQAAAHHTVGSGNTGLVQVCISL